jgi:hypothetical protein
MKLDIVAKCIVIFNTKREYYKEYLIKYIDLCSKGIDDPEYLNMFKK